MYAMGRFRLNVCMNAYMNTFQYTYAYTYIQKFICIYTYILVCVNLCICTYVCINVYMQTPEWKVPIAAESLHPKSGNGSCDIQPFWIAHCIVSWLLRILSFALQKSWLQPPPPSTPSLALVPWYHVLYYFRFDIIFLNKWNTQHLRIRCCTYKTHIWIMSYVAWLMSYVFVTHDLCIHN